MWFSSSFQGLMLAMCALIKTNFLFTTVNIMEIKGQLKFKLKFKMSRNDKKLQKFTSWYVVLRF